MPRIHVIGIGYRPLDRAARERLTSSDVVLASPRLMEVFPSYEEYDLVRDKVRVLATVDETISQMHRMLQEDAKSHIALIASGDPLFFGIGRKCLSEFGGAEVEIIPDLSSVQLAFARIKEPWDNTLFISLHGGPDPRRRRDLEYVLADLPSLAITNPSIAALTDRVNNPAVIARSFIDALLPQELAGIELFVCERLGYPDERIESGNPAEIARRTFADPNVVIIRNRRSRTRTDKRGPIGLTEQEITHARGLITKDEVRAISLHALRPPSRGVLWDIGAGSGSVSIEAARLCPGLRVFAVERDDEQIGLIRQNIEAFGLVNITVIEGVAPEALKGLPAPDRVFIGGSSGRMKDIIDSVSEKMSYGIVVVNAAQIETFTTAREELAARGFILSAAQVSVSRLEPIGPGSRFAPLNPIFVIKAVADEPLEGVGHA